MRWNELRVDADNERQLPGYRDPAVVRTFDAPEALDTRFYEIRAKTVINRVPPQSQVPFRWTINPYRGCSHACTYCQSGDTAILLASGRTSRLEDLSVGDVVVGCEYGAHGIRYVATPVLAHWSTRKAAYRIVLADGRELIASADHRYLTAEGWRFVAGTGPASLTVGAELVGTRLGRPADRPVHNFFLDPGPEPPERPIFRTGGSPRVRVERVEPLGLTMRLYDITTGTGDFIANGVVSHNCFARPTHTYLDMNAGRDFEKEIVVKVNAPEVLRAQLAKPSWKGDHIAMGTNTDPYQWVEGRYKLMRGIWEALRDAANPCSILTKSPLLLRDLDLMLEVGKLTTISANLSIPTLDEKMWRATEPHTPNPRARIEAVAELNRAGIPTGVLIAPLMPGINDAPEQVAKIVELCEEAGAVSIGGIALHLRGEVRGIFFDWLRAKRPDLIPQYEQMYRRGAYAPKEVQERVARLTKTSPAYARRYLRDRQEIEDRERERERRQERLAAQPSLF